MTMLLNAGGGGVSGGGSSLSPNPGDLSYSLSYPHAQGSGGHVPVSLRWHLSSEKKTGIDLVRRVTIAAATAMFFLSGTLEVLLEMTFGDDDALLFLRSMTPTRDVDG